MRDVELCIKDEVRFSGSDTAEVDVFVDLNKSLFGDEHITVAEMVRRVQLHGELVRALDGLMDAGPFDDADQRKQARAVLAKVKP